MAAPKPFVVPPPAPSGSRRFTYARLRALWIQAGGNPDLASTMAAVALAESNGDPTAHNQNAKTKDDSYGLWQINYYGNLKQDRTQAFGPADKMSDPLTNAKAAVALAGDGSGIAPNWTTFRSGAYKAYFRPSTPQERAANAAAEEAAKAANPQYVAASVDLSAQRKVAEQTAHLTDPWVTVLRNKAGVATGFGEAFGQNPPPGVLKIGGQPATKSMLSATWGATYDSTWQEYTGKVATAADMERVLDQGMSVYQLRNQLAAQPGFTQSPIYKANAPGIMAQAQAALGTKPPASFVNQAISQGWDSNTVAANLRTLPGYTKGPEYQQNFTQASDQYKGIYGLPDKQQNDWLKAHVLQGWTPDEIASKLRSDPAYKYSPEYASKAIQFLDAIGLYTGQRPVAAPAMKEAVAQAGQGSPLGPLPNPFQVSEGGQ